jgi:alpha-amylase/alpha-mannosidase (GH57 family)
MNTKQNQTTINLTFYLEENYSFYADDLKFSSFQTKINNQRQTQEFTEKLKSIYLPALTKLHTWTQENKHLRLNLQISGVFLERLETAGVFGTKALRLIKNLVESKQVSLVASSYYDSLSFIYSKEEYALQIRKTLELTKKHFQKVPKVMINPGLYYSDQLAEFLRNLGVKGLIAKSDSSFAPEKINTFFEANKQPINFEEQQLAKKQQISLVKAETLNLFLVNEELSKKVETNICSRKNSRKALNLTKTLAYLEGKQLVSLYLNLKILSPQAANYEQVNEFFSSLFSQMINFQTAEQLIENQKPPRIYSQSEEVAWSDPDSPLSSWLETENQATAIKVLWDLEQIISHYKHLDNPDLEMRQILADYRQLTNIANFEQMAYRLDQKAKLTVYPRLSPTEFYNHYLQALVNVKTRLKRFIETKQKNRKQRFKRPSRGFFARKLG